MYEMVDLALGTPEVGAVNFTVLHSLLHAVLRHLNLGNIKADMPSEPYVTKPADTGTKVPGAKPTKNFAPSDLDADREQPDHVSEADSGVTGLTSTSSQPGKKKKLKSEQHPEADSSPTDESVPLSRSPYHQLEDKVARLEKKWDDLEALPSNLELIESVRAGDKEKTRQMADMWQGMQLTRKVDANTEGVSKVSGAGLSLLYTLVVKPLR